MDGMDLPERISGAFDSAAYSAEAFVQRARRAMGRERIRTEAFDVHAEPATVARWVESRLRQGQSSFIFNAYSREGDPATGTAAFSAMRSGADKAVHFETLIHVEAVPATPEKPAHARVTLCAAGKDIHQSALERSLLDGSFSHTLVATLEGWLGQNGPQRPGAGDGLA